MIKAEKFGIGEEEIKHRFLELKNVEEAIKQVKNKKDDISIVIVILEEDLKEFTNSKVLKEELQKRKHLLLCLDP